MFPANIVRKVKCPIAFRAPRCRFTPIGTIEIDVFPTLFFPGDPGNAKFVAQLRRHFGLGFPWPNGIVSLITTVHIGGDNVSCGVSRKAECGPRRQYILHFLLVKNTVMQVKISSIPYVVLLIESNLNEIGLN